MAYSKQTFTVEQVLTAAEQNQIEDNIADHVHGENSVSPLVLRQNALINGNFLVPQRGALITAATTPFTNADDSYTLDRWLLLSDGDDIVDVSQSTEASTGGLYSLGMEVATASKKFGIAQIIEQKNALNSIGNTVSLSFNAKVTSDVAGRLDNIKAVVLSWGGTADTVTSDLVSAWGAEDVTPTWAANWTQENVPSDLSVGTAWTTCKLEGISIDTASTKNIAVFIWADGLTGTATDFLYIEDVQLEVGASATVFDYKDVSNVQQSCQRYFEKQYGQGIGGRSFTGYSNGTVNLDQTHAFAVEKRVVPTMVVNGTWNFTLISGVAIAGIGTDGYTIRATCTGAGLAQYYIDSADDFIYADAEM